MLETHSSKTHKSPEWQWFTKSNQKEQRVFQIQYRQYSIVRDTSSLFYGNPHFLGKRHHARLKCKIYDFIQNSALANRSSNETSSVWPRDNCILLTWAGAFLKSITVIICELPDIQTMPKQEFIQHSRCTRPQRSVSGMQKTECSQTFFGLG